MSARIELDGEKIAAFCRKHRIRKLSLFGSVLRDDLGPASDVNVLVEFEPAETPGLIRFVGMEIELAELLGRKVNFNTARFVRKCFRDEVPAEAEAEYVPT